MSQQQDLKTKHKSVSEFLKQNPNKINDEIIKTKQAFHNVIGVVKFHSQVLKLKAYQAGSDLFFRLKHKYLEQTTNDKK